MPDPERDLDWKLAYTSTALSSTFGSSTGTQVDIPTNGCNGLLIKATAVSLPSANELRITPVDFDGDSTETVPRKDNGTDPRYKKLTTTGMIAPYPVSAPFIRIEPWVDTTDAAASCTIYVKYIF
jgi:hypothetical protein